MQKKPTPWLPILIVLGVGIVIIAALCGFGLYSISKVVKEPPKAMAGAKSPTVTKDYRDGWARYSFAQELFEADLPGKPVLSDPGLDKMHSLLIKDWLHYEIESENAYLTLTVYSYRSKEFIELKDEVQGVQDSLRSDAEVTSLKTSDYKKSVKEKEGWESHNTYKFRGEDAVLKAFSWADGKSVYYLQTYHAPGYDEAANDDFYRVIESVKVN